MVYRFPDYFILATEACTGYSPLEVRGPVLGSWERGERYSHSIIEVSPCQTLYFTLDEKVFLKDPNLLGKLSVLQMLKFKVYQIIIHVSGFSTLGCWMDRLEFGIEYGRWS